jgi:hypothetical protein
VKRIVLWARAGGRPKAVAPGSVPPGPGPLYAVQARSSDHARELLARWLQVRGEDPARLAVRAEYEPGLLAVEEVKRG